MVVNKHRTTDPACQWFKGYPTNALAKLVFDRARGKACLRCMHTRSIVEAARRKYEADTGAAVKMLWTCGCGWTNTSSDLACVRCGAVAVDGYGFRL